jgi:hypothetical protein
MALFGFDALGQIPFATLPGSIYEQDETFSAAAGFAADDVIAFDKTVSFDAAAGFITDGPITFDKDVTFSVVAGFVTDGFVSLDKDVTLSVAAGFIADSLEVFEGQITLVAAAGFVVDEEFIPKPVMSGAVMLGFLDHITDAARRRRKLLKPRRR